MAIRACPNKNNKGLRTMSHAPLQRLNMTNKGRVQIK